MSSFRSLLAFMLTSCSDDEAVDEIRRVVGSDRSDRSYLYEQTVSDRQTLLHRAASTNKPKACVALMVAGANPAMTDAHERTAADVACEVNACEAFNAIFSFLTPLRTKAFGKVNADELIKRFGDACVPLTRHLVRHRLVLNLGVLSAVHNDSWGVVDALFDEGVTLVSGTDTKGVCDLLTTAARKAPLRTVERMMDHAGLDVRDALNHNTEFSPLMAAARRGHRGIMSLFLRHGAKWDVSNRLRFNALDYAISSGHADGVNLLLGYGCRTLEFGPLLSRPFASELVVGEFLRYGAEIPPAFYDHQVVLMWESGNHPFQRERSAAMSSCDAEGRLASVLANIVCDYLVPNNAMQVRFV